MNKDFVNISDILSLMAGDEPAFAAVYKWYAEKVYRLAFRFLKNQAQSEEIVQETFIKLWLTKGQLKPQGNLWLYLFVIAKRLSINTLRQHNQSAHTFEQLADRMAEIQNVTEEQVIAHDLEQFTEKILQKLPKQQQQVFKMSRREGLTHKEIAERLHISPNTVKNHMVEALKTLKSYLRYADFICLIFLHLYK
ncbi:RNA polymerase sigma-70 factor [uncultured Mucilaginibacter sp.]|uniref:RNA polymerase sigma factor n=1 Tax=uncultured Mucilaginibacter sp. TaxID=797541 RepID=UPI0026340A96|nr:RNA polymerase sigma-70 factor [uncultured Mucilaginibacter sp.]